MRIPLSSRQLLAVRMSPSKEIEKIGLDLADMSTESLIEGISCGTQRDLPPLSDENGGVTWPACRGPYASQLVLSACIEGAIPARKCQYECAGSGVFRIRQRILLVIAEVQCLRCGIVAALAAPANATASSATRHENPVPMFRIQLAFGNTRGGSCSC